MKRNLHWLARTWDILRLGSTPEPPRVPRSAHLVGDAGSDPALAPHLRWPEGLPEEMLPMKKLLLLLPEELLPKKKLLLNPPARLVPVQVPPDASTLAAGCQHQPPFLAEGWKCEVCPCRF